MTVSDPAWGAADDHCNNHGCVGVGCGRALGRVGREAGLDMAIVRFPKFLGGASRPEREPAPGWDVELQAMQGIGEWLATIPTDEGKYRALAYFMWRLKSGDRPNIEQWVDSIAEQSAVTLAQKHGFKEGAE